jgi:carboxymethylenebutenolidase
MSSKERRTVPVEAIQLYNDFIHGDINRREFLDGVKKFAVAGITTGSLVTALMPDYAMGQQISRADERIRAEYVTIPSPQGHGHIKGYLVRPFSADSRREESTKLPGIIVVHENRGLNPHTEDVARRFALENFMTTRVGNCSVSWTVTNG